MSVKLRLFNFLFSTFVRPRILRTWEQADINLINQQEIIIPCPYCGHDNSEYFSRWTIDHPDYVGLFDNDLNRLSIICGSDLRQILPKKGLFKKVLSMYINHVLDLLVGRSYVDYRRCLACNLIFQNFPHTPASKEFYYREMYRLRHQEDYKETGAAVYGRADDPHFVGSKELLAKHFLDTTKLPQRAKILDIGCAEGIVCRYLAHIGMVPFGIEPSFPMANYAKKILGLDNIMCGNYSSDVYPTEFFDGMVSHHVIEHVVDIRGFFSSLSKHLKPGGYLLVQTPCVDNIKSPDEYGKILLGGHLYGFSEKFLRDALVLYGFEILSCKKTPCDMSELDQNEVAASYNRSIWGDVPCGISILTRKI